MWQCDIPPNTIWFECHWLQKNKKDTTFKIVNQIMNILKIYVLLWISLLVNICALVKNFLGWTVGNNIFIDMSFLDSLSSSYSKVFFVKGIFSLCYETREVKNILNAQSLRIVTEFEPPQYPNSICNGPFPSPKDFAKIYPPITLHSHFVLLNVPLVAAP